MRESGAVVNIGRLRAVFPALVASGLCVWAAPAGAEPYLLGPQDRLRLRVAEWQTAEGSFREWSSVSGDYLVGPSGAISVPLVGELDVSGRTTAEISKEIGGVLQQKLGLSDKPEAALEVAEFRPFYVSGDVKTPGAFPFAPGLTVMKAVALSGGVRQAPDNQRVFRDFVQAEGGRDVHLAEFNRLQARKVRVEAEIAGKSEIATPAVLMKSASRDALLADEKAILLANDQRLALQLKSLKDLEALLLSEVASLTEKRTTIERQLTFERKELAGVNKLADRGLVVNNRVSEMQRSVSDLESRMLDLDVASLRAKQDISKANQDAIVLRNDRSAKLAADLQETEADIEKAELQLKTQQGLMQEAALLSPDLNRTTDKAQFEYKITRMINGKSVAFAAQPDTDVRPGDLVEMSVVFTTLSSY